MIGSGLRFAGPAVVVLRDMHDRGFTHTFVTEWLIGGRLVKLTRKN